MRPRRNLEDSVAILPGQLAFPFMAQPPEPPFEWWACEDCADLFVRATANSDDDATFARARALRCTKHHAR